MKIDELLKYCHFYKGENKVPESFDRRPEGKIWLAESFACDCPELFDGYENIEKRMVDVVCAHISKWDVYENAQTLKVYFKKSPRYEKEFLKIYCM